jgi:hypothetical protein
MPTPHIRILKTALDTLGSKARLALALDITAKELDAHLAGKPLPTPKFIEAWTSLLTAKPHFEAWVRQI